MRYLLLLLLITSPAFAQEAWEDDVADSVVESVVEDNLTPPILVDPLADDVADIKQQLAALAAKLDAVKMPEPQAACQCNCDCPTLDQIRAVVREELDRVTVTVKTVAGVEKKLDLPLLKKSSPSVAQLQPGDRVVAIDGKPVTPFTWQTSKGSGVGYKTPAYEMRTIVRGDGYFGAVRQQTCRTVNGVRVCQ